MSTLATAPQAGGRSGPPRSGSSLRLTWLVARRELRIRAKTRVFAITTAIMMIAVVLAVVLPVVLSGKHKPDHIGVVGATPAINGIVTEAGRLSGGQAIAVPQPSLAAAEASKWAAVSRAEEDSRQDVAGMVRTTRTHRLPVVATGADKTLKKTAIIVKIFHGKTTIISTC